LALVIVNGVRRPWALWTANCFRAATTSVCPKVISSRLGMAAFLICWPPSADGFPADDDEAARPAQFPPRNTFIIARHRVQNWAIDRESPLLKGRSNWARDPHRGANRRRRSGRVALIVWPMPSRGPERRRPTRAAMGGLCARPADALASTMTGGRLGGTVRGISWHGADLSFLNLKADLVDMRHARLGSRPRSSTPRP